MIAGRRIAYLNATLGLRGGHMSRVHRFFLTVVSVSWIASLVLPAVAGTALSAADANCRKKIAGGARKVVSTVLKQEARCFSLLMKGTITGTNCADPSDPAFPGALSVSQAALKLALTAQKGCAIASPPSSNGYVFCPSPCDAVSTADYNGVGACLACLATASASGAIHTA